MWACGVVLYTLLAGFPPFWHRRQLMMIRQIMEANFSFTSSEWKDITRTPKDLITRMLTVTPEERLTISQCLDHDFFRSRSRRSSFLPSPSILSRADSVDSCPFPVSRFDARKTFRLAILRVKFLVRLRRIKQTPEPVSLVSASQQPYSMKIFRRVIDGAAFRIYGHWVKRGEGQNRAAMFELRPKQELVRKRRLEAELTGHQ